MSLLFGPGPAFASRFLDPAKSRLLRGSEMGLKIEKQRPSLRPNRGIDSPPRPKIQIARGYRHGSLSQFRPVIDSPAPKNPNRAGLST